MINNESFKSRLWRWSTNFFSIYKQTGAKVNYISADFQQVEIKIDNNRKTKNHIGITWGGGLYSALDPVFGVMLFKLLGKRYRVVDKEATIHFLKPAKTCLYAKFIISDQELSDIKQSLKDLKASKKASNIERNYSIELVDKQGKIYVRCHKKLSIGLDRNYAH